MRRIGLTCAWVLVVGCSSRLVEDGAEDTTGTTMVGDDDDDGDGGDDDVVEEFSGDCAELPVSGPTVGPGAPGPSGFPIAGCNPRLETSGDNGYVCCSDDPAAAGGALPSYQDKNITDAGTPYFSGANNPLGTTGMCVRTSDIPFGAGLLEAAASGCPIPCNPTWDAAAVAEVCGAALQCCQTRELQPRDCVLDESSGLWRPVTGRDVGAQYEDGRVVTNWAPASHATHQDPGGIGCSQLAGGNISSDEFADCVAQLSVADQRGFCMALGPGGVCPLAQPAYVDACEQINMGAVPPPG